MQFLVTFATLFINSIAAVSLESRQDTSSAPFLTQLNDQNWVIGNGVWNLTQGPLYGVKLFYKGRDCVGNAVGHYVSYNGAANNLAWTSASIVKQGLINGSSYIDVSFTATEGNMHWIIVAGLAGAYQYFENRNLPTLGEFRTLWRLDNTTFPRAKTDLRDQLLPPLSDYITANKVQDETWLEPDGKGYITKYDLTSWIRTQTYYGVYGVGFGSWYINAGKDYYNGNHLKQELMVHRESATGDAVQLNMIHGTHFQGPASDVFPKDKLWGPWLWYLNDGTFPDVANRAAAEFAAWPYEWFDNAAYQTRGTVKGTLTLSDGRPATNAAVFLGDNHPTKTALSMGSDYYYTGYADADGNFEFEDVRVGSYGFQAWSNGSKLADVTTSFLKNDVVIRKNETTDLKTLTWQISRRTKLFQVGDFDRTSHGFAYGGSPYTHGVSELCPANINYSYGTSTSSDWCFVQSKLGNWTIAFNASASTKNAVLIVSLAGYSTGVSADVLLNNIKVGNLTSGITGSNSTTGLANDPSVYRSGTTAGEWRYFEFPVSGSLLKNGKNEVKFWVRQDSKWHGFMWDSIVLEREGAAEY